MPVFTPILTAGLLLVAPDTYDGGTHTLTVQNISAANSLSAKTIAVTTGAITMSFAGSQSILKDSGPLVVGTFDANYVELRTNNIGVINLDSAQGINFPRLTTNGFLATSGGAGAVSVYAGFTNTDILYATGASSIGQSSDFTWTNSTRQLLISTATVGHGGSVKVNAGAATGVSIGSTQTAGVYVADPNGAGEANIACDDYFFGQAVIGYTNAALGNLSVGGGTGGALLLVKPMDRSGASAGTIVTVDATGLGFYGTAGIAKQTSGANLTNNVTSGGTNDTIADFADLTTYSNSAATIRNDIYQLARKLKQINDGLRSYGLFT